MMTDHELRQKNLETVKDYFKLHGTDRLRLFTEDGAKRIPFSPSYLTIFSWEGIEDLKGNFEFNKSDLKSWEFKDPEIIPALDPNLFFVRTVGEGVKTKGNFYKNLYFFQFRLKEGLITEMLEYTNPINGMVAEGFEIPEKFLWDETKPPFDRLKGSAKKV